MLLAAPGEALIATMATRACSYAVHMTHFLFGANVVTQG